ncbi:uncharacterized protein Z518_06337 [Rhinocladiella mackenziei CBS 650.93]|uniref:Uncharacterized protein n=1 Tax=Rhinocladiella mackenziei CBS 650.93 TaxID=1442369 RepID=A0A0D2J8N6_9EURO|nr:uncharacterized protein Z518_06337 [Rhinocladiella mackenziei CBS 650.93]KIX05465.1 hypothetical protein Z518_06337 [Rhinocladiella mackenziei CBS 650.93]
MFSVTSVESPATTKSVDLEERIRASYRPKKPKNKEEYDKKQKKDRAQAILSNYQIMMSYALANDKSLPQTRAYFQKVALGIPTEPIIKNWFTSGS